MRRLTRATTDDGRTGPSGTTAGLEKKEEARYWTLDPAAGFLCHHHSTSHFKHHKRHKIESESFFFVIDTYCITFGFFPKSKLFLGFLWRGFFFVS